MASPTQRLFISYRRETSAGYGGWIHQLLSERLGKSAVFRDVDSIGAGEHFASVIAQSIAACTGVLVLIDPDWGTVTDEHGRPRLSNPDDWVRLEIETALAKGVPILPFLIRGARMPSADTLPQSLRRLTELNAISLHEEDLRKDLWRGVEAISDNSSSRPRQFMGSQAKKRDERFSELVRMYKTEVEEKSFRVSYAPWLQAHSMRPMLEAVLDNLSADEDVIDMAVATIGGSLATELLFGLAILTNQRIIYSPRYEPTNLTSVTISQMVGVRRGVNSVKIVMQQQNFELNSILPLAKISVFSRYLKERLKN